MSVLLRILLIAGAIIMMAFMLKYFSFNGNFPRTIVRDIW